MPVLIKDLVDTAGVRTTYGSSIYADHVPERSAPAVTALEAQGAIVVGKANLDEFAWGVCGQNTFYGDTVNPTAPDRVAGGSSSGNAAALAAGMVPLALGTDTGGSVRHARRLLRRGRASRRRSARCRREGVFPLAASFDTVGPMARTVADCALAYAVLTATEVPAPALAGPAHRRADRLPGPRAARGSGRSATSARSRTSSACARSAPTCASSRCRCPKATRGRSSTPTRPRPTRPPSPAGATSTGR